MHAHWCWRANRSIVNSKWFFKSFHTSSKRDRERWTVRVKKNIGKRSEYGRLMYMYNKLLLIIFCPNSSLFLYTHTHNCVHAWVYLYRASIWLLLTDTNIRSRFKIYFNWWIISKQLRVLFNWIHTIAKRSRDRDRARNRHIMHCDAYETVTV